MPIRPGWHDDYWKKRDKNSYHRKRSTCPRCGSADTYYNQHYKTWRCGKCEHIFVVKGLDDKAPWWKHLFRKGD